jgi:hypothetical protein
MLLAFIGWLPPQALQKRYTEFCRCLRPPTQPLDVRCVQRRRRPRGNWLQKAAAAMPANVPLDGHGWAVKQQQQQQNRQQQQGKMPSYDDLLVSVT